MKRALAAVCALLCLLTLSACEIPRTLDLPEIEELKQEIFAAVPSIKDISVTYGNSLSPNIRMTGEGVTDEQAFSIVKRVRTLFSDSSFQSNLFQALETAPRVPPRSIWAPHILICITDKAWKPETNSGVKYQFASRYFALKDGLEVDEVDGYATWWGSRISENDENCKNFSMEEILAAD